VNQRVHHGLAPRAGVTEEQLKAFLKRPLSSVTDAELALYFEPRRTVLGDLPSSGVCTNCDICREKRNG
jgi:hypothetical protein